MLVDILGTSWDQCRSMVQYSFTSTETRWLVRTDSPGQPPRLSQLLHYEFYTILMWPPFLRATAVTRGWNGYRNKSQHRKSTLEKKILPPFQQGFEPATFQSRVRCSNHWAIPAPRSHTAPELCVLYNINVATLSMKLQMKTGVGGGVVGGGGGGGRRHSAVTCHLTKYSRFIALVIWQTTAVSLR